MIPLTSQMNLFQSTLPSRGVTSTSKPKSHKHDISIHTPLAGSDEYQKLSDGIMELFQSTLPSRGVTNFRYFLNRYI